MDLTEKEYLKFRTTAKQTPEMLRNQRMISAISTCLVTLMCGFMLWQDSRQGIVDPYTVFLLVLTFVLFLFRKLAEPKIVGDQTGLHPLLSLMSMYVGMKLAGILGMILSPIIMLLAVNLYVSYKEAL